MWVLVVVTPLSLSLNNSALVFFLLISFANIESCPLLCPLAIVLLIMRGELFIIMRCAQLTLLLMSSVVVNTQRGTRGCKKRGIKNN